MKQLRNKLGMFVRADGKKYKRKPFSERYVKAQDVRAMIDDAVKKAAGGVKSEELQDLLDDAFLDGHKLGVRDGTNDKRMQTFSAWKNK